MNPSLILRTISNFRNHLQLLMEDIELESKGHTLAFYFDTEHLQRAALGYKDYYYNDLETFKTDQFADDTTLVCSLLSAGSIGQFRLLPPHQNEFLKKINSNFNEISYERWRGEVHTFIEDSEFDLNVDELVKNLQNESDEDLIKRITAEHTEATKKAFNVTQCLLPWDRRLAGWERKKLLVLESDSPNYDAIFVSRNFNNLREAMTRHRKHHVSNFIDAAALTILMDLTRQFRLKTSRLVPRFFIATTKPNLFRRVLRDTSLTSELSYLIDNRESSVIRHEEYFFYRSFFRLQTGNAETGWGVRQIKELYEKASTILDRYESIETLELDDKPLQEIIEGMENYSFLKNVWIEFINSGDLRNIVGNLDDIKKHFDDAKRSYDDISFADQVKNALKASRATIFKNLDVVQKASLLWNGIHKHVSELRGSISIRNLDGDTLYRNRKLFRYGFPEELHQQIKEYLVLLLSPETEEELTRKVLGKLVHLYHKVESPEGEEPSNLIVLAAVFCALNLRDQLKAVPERVKKRADLHYSVKIALAGAEFDSNNYKKGMDLIKELEKVYYRDGTPAATQCDLAIGLTYLYYYAWMALKRISEREQAVSEDPELGQRINSHIHHAIVFAERANVLVAGKPLAQRVYVYNQYFFCLVESENPENNKKMRDFASKLIEYRGQTDVWSYLYSDTLSRYFRLRARLEPDKNHKLRLMAEALHLSEEARRLAPDDAEVSAYYTRLLNEMDSVEVGATS